MTLAGKLKDDAKTWKFFVGKESADKTLVYVNSSDQDDKVFAVGKKGLENLFFKDARYLRSKRIFDFVESAVSTVEIKKGDKELELKRGDNQIWTIARPPLGFAGYDTEAPPEEKKLELKKELPKEAVNSVKALMNAIMAVRVDEDNDFEPLGESAAKFGVESDKANMRIEIASSADKKETSKEILLIGNKVNRDGEFYYARLADDDGIMMIGNARWLKAILKALDDPGKDPQPRCGVLRALKDIDAIVVKHGKDEVQFLKEQPKDIPEHKFMPPGFGVSWEMVAGSERKKADAAAQRRRSSTASSARRAIVDFLDVPEADLKKERRRVGLRCSCSTSSSSFRMPSRRERRMRRKS